ncbi:MULTISPECIES: efflux RND transporter periplasmic adaptor subunit [unclassified Pseudoxanthomonas]|uniref:efflux RND transporter periplasmic adaptor subunit n=1 Tax=unclassified Pseudoxanthomonas TaxID=2645906 RepID=UPI0008E4BBA9|nr:MULTISPECIES: efflux RND transporter periplasmic adaptor subunit [unclassified Pseudoxanthomonas]PPJ42804.1 efflux RND transporter periplasmic adaptor subunit [Pseudoxanthomonas sp. KAs_5_3]SFV26266.1 membrane fusion protein, multidrug efflux system [Pseudoxanthomonas sp. YR558]
MSRPSPLSGRPYLRLALVPVLCSLLVLTACKGGGPTPEAQAKNGEAPKEPDAVPVEVAKATHRPVAASYSGTAALEALGESQVVAKTSGVALAVLVEEGQVVRAGQALVRLDPDRLRLQVAQAEAQMRKLENNYRRAQQLVEQQMISANDVDQIKYDLENARAVYRAAALELSYTTVTAPISGVVASRSIKTGNFVQINTPIIRVVDQSRLEATLNVPERELSTLKAGQPVALAVDALRGKVFQGTVDRIAPVVDAGSGTFRVVCSFASDGVLQPGMFGRIKIDYDQRADALVVPRVALLDDGDPAVYAVRSGKATRVPVKLGYVDGEWIEVREGLKAGDQVVTAGKVALREGSTVQVIGAEPAKVAAKADADKTAGTKQ